MTNEHETYSIGAEKNIKTKKEQKKIEKRSVQSHKFE